MKIKKSIFLFILLIFVSCASVPRQNIKPKKAVINYPKINEVVDAEVGDTLVKKGIVYEFDAIKTLKEVSVGDGVVLIKYTLEPQVLVLDREDKNWKYFVATNGKSKNLSGEHDVFAGIMINKKNDKVAIRTNVYS